MKFTLRVETNQQREKVMAMIKKNKNLDAVTMERMQETIETLVRRVSELESLNAPPKKPEKKNELRFGQTKEGKEFLERQKNDPDFIEISPGDFISRYDVLAGQWIKENAMNYMTQPRVWEFYDIYVQNKAIGMQPKAAYENAVAIATGTNTMV